MEVPAVTSSCLCKYGEGAGFPFQIEPLEGEKVIDQCGFPTADVYDRSRATSSRPLYQSERSLKVRTVPADCVRGFLCVDLLPVGLRVHTDQCPRVMDSSLMIGPS